MPASAASASSSPAPHFPELPLAVQNVFAGCARAVVFSTVVTWAGVSAGLMASIMAATPETIGAAKLVPCESVIV